MRAGVCKLCRFVELRQAPGVDDVIFPRCREGKRDDPASMDGCCNRFKIGPFGYWIEKTTVTLAFRGKPVGHFALGKMDAVGRHLRRTWAEDAVETCQTAFDIVPFESGTDFLKWLKNTLGTDDPLPVERLTLEQRDRIKQAAIDRYNLALGVIAISGGSEEVERRIQAGEV